MNSSVHCRGAGMRRTFRQHLQNVLVCLFVALVVWPPGVGFCADPAQAAVAPEAKADFAPQARPAGAKTAAIGSGFRVELVKSAPTEGTLRVGGAASFEARLYAGERELPGEAYVCRWLSDAGARFLEAEGPPRNTAVFMRPGRQRVWVEVVPRSGPSQGLAGVSEAVELEVGNPSFALSVTPPAPLVGEEVTVAIRDFPVHDGVEFRWDPLPAKAKLVSVSERGLTFFATEPVPIPVKVTATVGGSGTDLGAAKVTVAAKPHTVTVENRGLAEAPAVVWREGVGPVPAEGVAVGQQVLLRATVAPATRHPPLEYTWSLCPGAKTRERDASREILAARQEVGPCTARVEVRDGRGILIGRGEGAFTVDVSREQLDAAVANVRETERLVADADQAWREGQVERAEELAGRAVKLDPAHGAAVATLERVERDKGRLDAVLDKARQALGADDFDEVAAMLGEAGKVNPKAAAIAAVARDTAQRKAVLAKISRQLAQARDKWDAGEVEAALSLTGQALDLDPNHVAARAERERMVSGRDRLIAALKQSAGFLAAKRFDSAAAALSTARSVNARFPAIAEMEQAIANRKDRAWRLDERLARARDQWNGGDADGALGTLTEATALDPEHPGAATARKSLAEARDRLRRAEDKAESALGQGNLAEAKTALDEAARICPRHPHLAELVGAVAARANRDKQLAGLRAEANRHLAAGDLDGAVGTLDAMLALAPGEAALVAERDRLARSRDVGADAVRRATGYLADRRYDLALAALAEADKAKVRSSALGGLKQRVLGEKAKAESAAASKLAQARTLLTQKEYPAARDALEAARKTGALSTAQLKDVRELDRRVAEGLVHQEAARREQAVRTTTKPSGTAEADRRARCAAIGQEAASKRTTGDHAGAIRSYQTLLELCPDTCQAYNNVGASLFSLGYLAEAVPWFDEAVKCAPAERLYRDNAAMTRSRLAAASRPAAETEKVCAEGFAAAESLRTAGDLAGALKGYRAVVARCPDFCAAYNNMGLALHKLGRPADSLPLFEQALRCNPKDNLFRENYDLTAKRLRTAESRP